MELQKLKKEEHSLTRALWESVFTEDTEAFLDYYYQVKTRDNQIYVMNEDKKIRAMLQLNSYRVQIQNERFLLHYIIAVATEKQYRGRGMMQALLLQAMQDMYRKKEPFTFLMPAAKAIYTPYNFRFVYDQIQMEVEGRELEVIIDVKEAKKQDASKLALFARKLIGETYQIYAVRSKGYYETLIDEQHSENGGIKMVYCDRRLVGTFMYGIEDDMEIREPLFLEGYETLFLRAIYEMKGEQKTCVTCIGLTEKFQRAVMEEIKKDNRNYNVVRKPMIMARIIHLETFLQKLCTREDQDFSCSFAIIDPRLTPNNRIFKMKYHPDLGYMEVRDSEDSEGVLTIDAFTSFIFGYSTMEQIEKEEGVLLTEHLKDEFTKIKLIDQIFLNEIV